MRRRQISLYYCNGCKATTRHAESETTSTCLRCGLVKYASRIVKADAQHKRQSEANDADYWN